jgi:GPH family glycoside/pentoside/hexuronide:cation symporter
MSPDYNERSGIAGYKQIFAVVGTLLGAGAAMPLMALFAGRSAGFVGMSAIFGALAAVSLLVTFFSVREPKEARIPQDGGVLAALRDALGNRPYLLILFTWFANSTAVAIMQSMLIYYYKYLIGDEGAVTLAMLSLLAATLVTIPLWVWLCKAWGKKPAYLAGMSLTLAAVLAFAFTADRLGNPLALGLMVLAGVGFASHYVAPWAIVPDTIEYGYAQSGQRREGVYYSLWTFVVALGGALAGFLVGQGLELFGYVPDAVQSERSLLGMRLLIGVLPGLIIVIGNTALAFYPLTKKRYEEMLARINKNKQE